MARAAAKLLAEMRAMEEQGERMNPVNPKKVLAGSGATPSMGLSQFRGGKHTLMDHIAAPTKGFGKKKMEKESESESESETDSDSAEGAGRMLGQTLHKLHGGRYLAAFHRGMAGGIQTGAYEGEGKSLHAEANRAAVSEASMDSHRGAGHSGGIGMGGAMSGGAPSGGMAVGGKKKRAAAGPNDKRRARGAKISHLMKSKGMTLAEASKYLKEHS